MSIAVCVRQDYVEPASATDLRLDPDAPTVALHNGLSDHEYIVAHDQWDATIRAYHASIAFVDRQIGR